MMTYEDFKGKVTEEFMNYMPEEYKNMELKVHKVNKINRTSDCIGIIDDSVSGVNVSPNIYINDMYEKYMQCADFEAVMNESVETMVAAMGKVDKVVKLDFTTAKDNIVFQLINTEQNKEMLESVPHRGFLDLSIIYRLLTKLDNKGIQSAIIINDLAERIGFTEEQLFKLAIENTRRIFPLTVKTMNDVLREMMPPEMEDLMIEEIPADKMMWVISNNRLFNGASSMLYEDKLHELALELDDDLYILPSSTYEVMAVSASNWNPYELAEMVSEVNMSQVELEDRLSNQVYHYDKDLRKLSLVTDIPNKRLDGAEAKQ